MSNYYLIQQVILKNLKCSFKIRCPSNITHIKKLIKYLTGNVYVYLVNEQDNSKENLTEKLGKTDFDYHEFLLDFKNIDKIFMQFKIRQGHWAQENIVFYSTENIIFDIFFCNGNTTYPCWSSQYINLLDYTDSSKKIYKGLEYEKFIGKKYEIAGYHVRYRGDELGKQDGGIDLLVENDDTIFLVQCKNWIEIDNYQIESRDLRAFIGDCYIYLLQNIIKKKVSFHYIIGDNQMLSESAKYFLKNQKMLKLQEIRFESIIES
ncbi:restriction endonuclease [Sulfuricurvum sp.]|uniref:restriction endonuclease n=1 Tax=Sulfuricurvum sp. TaxID=2025608 RepID=UPI00262A9E02|nr:restriction endonuclease [Sulfuricurvum sp.]MDD2780702.1 restriction endonuclease [Sulfuricurvum sp.]